MSGFHFFLLFDQKLISWFIWIFFHDENYNSPFNRLRQLIQFIVPRADVRSNPRHTYAMTNRPQSVCREPLEKKAERVPCNYIVLDRGCQGPLSKLNRLCKHGKFIGSSGWILRIAISWPRRSKGSKTNSAGQIILNPPRRCQ